MSTKYVKVTAWPSSCVSYAAQEDLAVDLELSQDNALLLMRECAEALNISTSEQIEEVRAAIMALDDLAADKARADRLIGALHLAAETLSINLGHLPNISRIAGQLRIEADRIKNRTAK